MKTLKRVWGVGCSMSKGDFKIIESRKEAHLWARDVKEYWEVVGLLQADLKMGGYSLISYIQDEKPDIFKEE